MLILFWDHLFSITSDSLMITAIREKSLVLLVLKFIFLKLSLIDKVILSGYFRWGHLSKLSWFILWWRYGFRFFSELLLR